MQTLLAIDDVSLPFRKNVHLQLSTPTVRPEPVLMPSAFESDAPDNLAAHFYGTVLHDEGTFRMWYYACHWGKNPDWPPKLMQQIARTTLWAGPQCPLYAGPICYAESDDGIVWRKPPLGQVLFKGSRANHALAIPHVLIGAADVIKDTDDPDPARRYKMVYQFFPDQADPPISDEYGDRPTIALACSPDGLVWTVTSIPFRGQFIEQSSFYRHGGRYVVQYHVMDSWSGWRSEGGAKCGRVGVARVSSDWDNWPDLITETFALAEPEDHALRGMDGPYDQVHMGVGAASFGNVCVGLYGMWHNADNKRSYGEISCDFGLVVSNDGVHFREPARGRRFIRREDSPVTPMPGLNAPTVLCQGNGILNVGDQTRIYHSRWRNVGHDDATLRHYYAEVALATLPRDRWGALTLNDSAPGDDVTEGVICSATLTLSDRCELRINADTSPGGLSVDLLDEHFRPVAGFSGGAIQGEGLSCPVHWPGRSISELAGQSVRVQIRLRRQGDATPRVYAMYLATV